MCQQVRLQVVKDPLYHKGDTPRIPQQGLTLLELP